MTIDARPPTAMIQEARYEYVVARCPHEDCGEGITLSRVDDLEGVIAEYFAKCPVCCRRIRITGDSLNSLPQQLLYEAQELIDQKRAILAVMAICQAYEVYFAWFMKKRLVYDLFSKEISLGQVSLPELNQMLLDLHEATGKWAFDKLRSCFFEITQLEGTTAKCEYRSNLISDHKPQMPKKSAVAADARLNDFYEVEVHTLRNKSVHHKAYRPSRGEVDAALLKAKQLLLGDEELIKNWDLTMMLDKTITVRQD